MTGRRFTVPIGKDEWRLVKGGLLLECQCSCADVCPQGRVGSRSRCWIFLREGEPEPPAPAKRSIWSRISDWLAP